MSTLKATNLQHASATNPAIVLAADGSATANVSSINSGPLAGFRNAIINGNFDFWQRGTSFSSVAANAYVSDRWYVTFNSGGTRTVTRQAFTLGQTSVPGEPTYYLNWDQTVATSGGSSNDLRQSIESVRTFADQTVTVSFWIKAAASATLNTILLTQNFGTGGSPSASRSTTLASSVAITTIWQKLSYSVALPSISGKTLGTDNNDSLELRIRMPLGSTFSIDIAQVQVERGPVSSTFERRPIGTELALCQRYYCKTFKQDVAPATNTGDRQGAVTFTYTAAGGFRTQWSFPVEMRAVPNVTSYNPNAANGSWRDITNNADYGAAAAIAIGTRQMDASSSASAGGSAVYMLHLAASAEL